MGRSAGKCCILHFLMRARNHSERNHSKKLFSAKLESFRKELLEKESLRKESLRKERLRKEIIIRLLRAYYKHTINSDYISHSAACAWIPFHVRLSKCSFKSRRNGVLKKEPRKVTLN
jgi:hypothetical protein